MTSPSDLEALIERLRDTPSVNLSGNVVDAAKIIRQMMVDRADAAAALSAALKVTEPFAPDNFFDLAKIADADWRAIARWRQTGQVKA